MLPLIALNIFVALVFVLAARKLIVTLYFTVNYIVLINPSVLELVIGATHPLHRLDPYFYSETLLFVAAFNVVLGVFFLIFQRALPSFGFFRRMRLNRQLDQLENSTMVLLISFAFFAIAIAAKITLDGMGAFRMLEQSSTSPALQLIKVFASFDRIVLIFLGEYKSRRVNQRNLLNLGFGLIFLVSLIMAIMSGSRSQAVIVMLIAAIAHRGFLGRHLLTSSVATLAMVPPIFVLFPFLAIFRNSGYRLEVAVVRLSALWTHRDAILLDVLTTRLNYFEPVAHAVEYVRRAGAQGGAIYWNNFLGIVPRLFWPGKPEIQNNSHVLGHQLGLLSQNDDSTSIGLRVIGEAFFELGWFGLIVAVFQALLFAALHKNFGETDGPALATVCIFAAMYLVFADGYFAIVPGLVLMAIGFVVFFSTMSFLLRSNRVQKSFARD
ncbi:hypothetical protein JYU02_00245 [bacterium AH-315-P15]|nr:hypothetical protein [bacterium AH-315-P15]